MHTLSAIELLDIWEAGRSGSPLDQAVLLLLMVYPDLSPAAAEALPLGQRDALLLQLREAIFGPRLESVVSCPTCGERLEFAFTCADLGAENYPTPPAEISVSSHNYAITARLPTTADIRATDQSNHTLQQRCLVDVRHEGKPVASEELPAPVVAAVATQLQQADPLLDVQLSLDCPACRHRWQAPFDAVSFFWQEIEAWAQRMLYTVHLLARAYGWSERDILSMSAWRRQYYVELASG